MRKILNAVYLLALCAPAWAGLSYDPNAANDSVARAAAAAAASAANSASSVAATAQAGAKQPGEVFMFAGSACPAGSLIVGTTAGTLNRTGTYAALFAAVGTTWGAGDGSTTFGAPWLAADYSPVQASANVGTSTVGQVIAHTHAEFVSLNPSGGTVGISGAVALSGQQGSDLITGSTGGSANLAAGVRFVFCVRY